MTGLNGVPRFEDPACGCCGGDGDRATGCFCGVDDLLRVIRRRYSLAVMNVLHSKGTARYHDVSAVLPAMSSSTLSETLRALEAARLLVRQQEGLDRPVTRYALTAAGIRLLNRLRELLDEVE